MARTFRDRQGGFTQGADPGSLGSSAPVPRPQYFCGGDVIAVKLATAAAKKIIRQHNPLSINSPGHD